MRQTYAAVISFFSFLLILLLVASQAAAPHPPAIESLTSENLQGMNEAQLDEIFESGNEVRLARRVPSPVERVGMRRAEFERFRFEETIARLESENAELKRAVERLELSLESARVELVICGSRIADGPVAEWVESLPQSDRPTPSEIYVVEDMQREYPVRWTAEEMSWVAERTRLNDWKVYGASIDEAVICFLGAHRIASEVDPGTLERIRGEWSEEGVFGR